MSVVDNQNLNLLLQQSKEELTQIKDRIQLLEGYVGELEDLHEKVLQLEAFQAGIETLLHLMTKPVELRQSRKPNAKPLAKPSSKKSFSSHQNVLSADSNGVFLPELAFQQADEILRHRQSMNYEIFRAVVLNGGKATTAEVRNYLIEQNISTPQGKSFENATLSEVYPRIAYLVKRGVLRPIGPGYFLSCFGWDHPASP
jgi:hypothetical protein